MRTEGRTSQFVDRKEQRFSLSSSHRARAALRLTLIPID